MQIILDNNDKTINEVFQFIEEALEADEGALIISLDGRNRAGCIAAAYMMKKYKWTCRKSMQYITSRCPELDLRSSFRQQLARYERRLSSFKKIQLSSTWERDFTGEEELMLRNTYLNSQVPSPGGDSESDVERVVIRRLSWSDGAANNKELVEPDGPFLGTGETPTPLISVLKPISKNVPESMYSTGTAHVEAITTITIKTPSGMVYIQPNEIVSKRYGLVMKRSVIVLEYTVPKRGLRAHHSMTVDVQNCSAECSNEKAAESLQCLHAPWLAGVSMRQLAQLIGRLRNGQKN